MHDGHRERLREKYASVGADAFLDHELLELLLCYGITRRDTNPAAHALIDAFGSLAGVLYADRKALESVPGIGANAALFLNVVRDIVQRAELKKRAREPIRTKGELAEYCKTLLRGATEEKLYALFLDARYNLIACRRISSGTPDEVRVYPRVIAEAALRSSAVHVAIVHNHPAGNSDPSPDDIKTTRKIESALEALGIDLIEHVIVTDEDCHLISIGRKYGGSLQSAAQSKDTGIKNGQKHKELDADEITRILNSMEKKA